MNSHAPTRLAVDFAMTALMAYQVVGDAAHEIPGPLSARSSSFARS